MIAWGNTTDRIPLLLKQEPMTKAEKQAALQEISDIGQEIEPVAYLMDGELFTAAEYQAIAEQGDGAQPLYVVSLKQKIEQAHTDHPARHWDRTCPACVEQAEKQEPVAWVRDLTSPQPHCVTSLKYLSIADTDAGVKYIPVYVAPPSKPWVSLTDDERVKCYETTGHYQTLRPQDSFAVLSLARAIEAKLKEKNHGN